MIIYIHGFASSGFGGKATYFKTLCAKSGRPFIAPSLPYAPELAVNNLAEWIDYARQREPVHLIGSSLGGYYGLYLAHRFGLKLALINPSIKPWLTLTQALGPAVEHYHDGSHFEWTQGHLDQLRTYATPPNEALARQCLLLVQTGDAVLDYREAVNHLAGARQVIEPGGDHGFQGIERHGPTVLQFFSENGELS